MSGNAKPAEKPARRVVKKARRKREILAKDELDIGSIQLPTERRHVSTRIEDYSVLFYGPYKFGKSTFFSSFPDALFLATEPGTTGLDIFEFNSEHGGVYNWQIMEQAVKMLERCKRFPNIIVDTADKAYKKCMRRVCELKGVKHPHDANDYGSTWDAVSAEYNGMCDRIRATGRALYFTSHIKEGEVEAADGQKFNRVGPTLTGQAATAVLASVHFIFYGQYVRQADGTQRRVIVTEGSDTVTAGQRKIAGGKVKLPPVILLPEDESQDYETFKAAFEGRLPAAHTADLVPSQNASKGAMDHMARMRHKAATQEGG
jgi:hypothetical protein